MSDVTKRTAEIIFSARNALIGGEPDKPLAEWAEDVEQAFIDDGWYHSPLVSHQMNRIEIGELMTRFEWEKEWLDRFSSELDSVYVHAIEEGDEDNMSKVLSDPIVVVKAAKKAAGIE